MATKKEIPTSPLIMGISEF